MIQWTYEKKQTVLAFVVLIGMIVGEFVFIILMSMLSQNLATGTISKEEYAAQQGKIGVILGVYVAGMFMLILILGVWMKLSQIEFEKDQISLDSIEAWIKIDEFESWKYLIQTNPDCSTWIRTTQDMKAILEQSEVFESLVKSIESSVEGFRFDQADIFKQMFNKEMIEQNKALPKKVDVKGKDPPPVDPSLPVDPKTELLKNIQNNEEMKIAWDHVDLAKLQAFFSDKLQKVFTAEQFKTLESKELYLFYRPIQFIKRIDDPDIDPNDSTEQKSKDRFSNLRGFLYLLPCDETDYFDFRKRTHPVDETLQLRKAYANFRFHGIFTEGVAFWVDLRLIEPITAKINDKSIADARSKALTFLTHLAVERDQELRDEIQDLRTDVVNLKRELDKKRDQELLRMLHDGELQSQWRRNFTFTKLNATSIVFGIIMLCLGILIGIVFFSGKNLFSNPTEITNTTTTTTVLLQILKNGRI